MSVGSSEIHKTWNMYADQIGLLNFSVPWFFFFTGEWLDGITYGDMDCDKNYLNMMFPASASN